MTEAGTLSYSAGGALLISAEAEHYRIEAEDLKQLLFYGRVIPIIGDRPQATAAGVAIEGHAAMNASGKAVMLHTRAGSYIIPLVSFQRVARGEAISAPLFPLIPENDCLQDRSARKPKVFEGRWADGCDGLRPEFEKATGFEPEPEHRRCEVRL